MTKYILNSGGSKRYPDKADKFNKEIVKDLGSSPRILFCFFATPRELWEEKFVKYSQRFLSSMESGVSPEIGLAFPDKFVEQVKNSDAIIIHGGDDNLLLQYLKKYDLPAIWQGKVVAGSSAGSDALVKHFWASDWRCVMEGLGILPIKFIPHYGSDHNSDEPADPIDWDKAYQELEDYGDKSLPIYALEEGDFIVENC
jgi:peptidase E